MNTDCVIGLLGSVCYHYLMGDNPKQRSNTFSDGLGPILVSLPWVEILTEVWKSGKKVLRGMANEGMYEVLEYESTLELKDKKGKKARLKKREKVRYLQDNIIAYQDQAWGDGKILINYRCTPGDPVDRYRSGYKTHILISLREVKNKGDLDEFNIEWGIRNGFLRKTGFWATEISHRTKKVKIQIIFPEDRPPLEISVLEKNTQRTLSMGKENRLQLPDGRWMILWERIKPRLYEHYIFNWKW
jgi:hypothetical protein